MAQKIKSLARYVSVFRNWPVAALARYLGRRLGDKRTLQFRDGRSLVFRPASDHGAMGELFICDSYGMARDLKDVKLIWDVGANIGCFSLWATRVFPKARIESFEPCEETFLILQENRNGNGAGIWNVYQHGFSNKDETAIAHVPRGMFGETSRFSTEGEKVILPLRDISRYWLEQGKPVIDLLKVDCEGCEHDIFSDASAEFLSAVQAIIMEVHPVPGRSARRIFQRLTENNFKVEQGQPDEEQQVVFVRK